MCLTLFIYLFIYIFLCDANSGKPPTELDLLPFTVTFLMSFWQIQYGIMGGVAVSGVLLLYNTARPQIKVAGGGVGATVQWKSTLQSTRGLSMKAFACGFCCF